MTPDPKSLHQPHPPSPRITALARIAAAVAAAPIAVVRSVLGDAVDVVDPVEIEEVLLQSHLFVGFPRALNAMGAWRAISPVYPHRASEALADERLVDSGEATCRQVYGSRYERLRANVRKLHPTLDEWMLHDGYGKVLSRPGLDLAQRELCIVAACTATDQRPQLISHLHGALNSGASPDQILGTLAAAAAFSPEGATESAIGELNRIMETTACL